MNRKSLIALAIVAASGAAFADDITVDTTPFVSTATRAEVCAEYIAQRDRVAAFTGEDSGSAYLAQQRADRASVLAGQPAATAVH